MTGRPSIVEFLRARLDEDERIASWATGPPWRFDNMQIFGEDNILVVKHTWPQEAAHITRWDPARVLAEVAFKRRIVNEHGGRRHDPCDEHDSILRSIPCTTLRLLALPYADHPDWFPMLCTGRGHDQGFRNVR